MIEDMLLESQEAERFVIDTPEKADWAIEKILEEKRCKEAFIWAAKARISTLESQIYDREEEYLSRTSNLRYKLEEYLKTAPCRETKTQKKLELPSGNLVLKKAKSEYQKDKMKLLDYITQNSPEYLKTEPKVKWGEFKKLLSIRAGQVIRTDTGELLDCIEVVEKPAELVVEE